MVFDAGGNLCESMVNYKSGGDSSNLFEKKKNVKLEFRYNALLRKANEENIQTD